MPEQQQRRVRGPEVARGGIGGRVLQVDQQIGEAGEALVARAVRGAGREEAFNP